MKTIYIRKNEPEHKKSYILLLGFIIVLLVCLRIAAPYALEAYINKTGADQRGYTYRVDDIDLKLLKGQVLVRAFEVFKARSAVNFVEASNLVFDIDPLKILSTDKIFSVTAGTIDLLLSKDLFEEINRIKNESKNKTGVNIYLEEVKAKVNTMNIRQVRGDKTESILTLKDANALLKDIGVGSINEKTEFSLQSKIAEGGLININGKTRLEAENTPWVINGDIKQISSAVLQKLAGDKLPFEIGKANMNAAVTAHSEGGQIEGVIRPDIKEFALSEEKEEGFIKRNVAKATNFLFDKTKDKDEALSLELPFTLNENFTINIPDTLDKLRRK